MITPPARPGPPPGLKVGEYELLSRIGEGGMGVVHLARKPGGTRVALKVIRPHFVGDDESRQRLAREVKSLSRIQSDRVSEIVDADPWGDIPYVATRYVDGAALTRHVTTSGPIAGHDLTWFAWCLAAALADVHACGVLHRDIKPSNVVMDGRSPVLIDFGLARVADDPKLTHTGWLLGTPGYLAPEILHGHDATAASDVHSWAATVAYAGTGRSPFGTGPSMAIMDRVRRGEHDLSGLPQRLRAQLTAALDPDPTRRPSLPELLDWLSAEAAGGAEADGARREASLNGHADAATETLATATALLSAEPAVAEPASPPEPSRAERLRRVLLLAVGFATLALASAAWPYLTTLALIVAVWILRSLSLTASGAGERRRARGPKWYDAPATVLSLPWHILGALAGTIMLVLWALGIGLATGLLGFALSLDLVSTLVLGGAAFVVSLWLGPGGSRVRRPVRRIIYPFARTTGGWVAMTLILLVAFGVTAYSLWISGIDWAPAGEAPFGSPQIWPEWLPR